MDKSCTDGLTVSLDSYCDKIEFSSFFLSFASFFLKFYCISLGGGQFQEQRVNNKGQGNEWDGDTYVKDTKNK